MEHKLQFDHPFVIFAQEVTKNSLANDALARLQRQQVLNINLILYGLWHGLSQRGRIFKQDIKALLQAIRPWHELVLLSLKRIAGRLPRLDEWFAVEILAAENIERQLIADTLFKLNFHKKSPAQQLSDACHNIATYCKIVNAHVEPQDQNAIIILLQVSFPNLLATAITTACEAAFKPASHPLSNHFSQLALKEV